MAWLGEGLSSLKGQITNFTKEVLSEVAEAKEDTCGHESQLLDAEEKIKRLESLCLSKDAEISNLKEQNAALELQTRSSQKHHHLLLSHVGSSPNLGGHLTVGHTENVTKGVAFDFSSMEAEKDDLVDYLRAEIRALKIDKEKAEKKVEVFKKRCLCLERGLAAKGSESASDGVTNSTEMLYTNNGKQDTSSGEGIGEMPQPPFQEIRAAGSEPLDARGECDGSEEVPKDFLKLMDQISELTASLSNAQLSVNRLQENEKELLRQIQRLNNEVLVSEDNVKSLTVQMENTNDCNRQLEEKLEELDRQNTSTIDQLMAIVSSEKSENEVLTFELKELQQKCQSLESELHLSLSDSKTQRREIELDLEKEVLKFVPPELIPREPRGDGGEGSWVVVVGAVKGLAKASEEHRWKRDALERKLSEMAKEMREVKAECVALRAEVRREKGGVRVTTEGLAPILETDGEEEEEEDEDGGGDDKEEGRGGGERTNWQDRCLALEEQMKRLMAERKDDEDDDGSGIEEVANEWTWQGTSDPASNAPLLLGDICVKDGEHVITTIANDVSGSEVCGECSVEQSRVPTLTEQYMGEKARLEEELGKLRSEKDLLERTLKDSTETILHMEEKVQALSADLDMKKKSESEFVCKENELVNQLSEFEAKIDSLERLLQTKNVTIMELETEVGSLRNDLLRNKECSADMKQRMVNLEAQARELETLLRSKDESLTEKEKLANDLEGQLKMMECNAMEGKVEEEERASRVEGEVSSLCAALDVEAQLRGREAEEAERRRESLEGRLTSEVRLKEEAVGRLEEERGRVEAMLSEAQSERRLREEAEARVGRLEGEMKQLNEQLSTCNGDQQQKDSLICDLVEKIKSLEMERERIMCVVSDKAREVSSLRSEKQRLMEAMSLMEKLRQQKEEVEGVGCTGTPPAADLEDDGAIQLLSKLNNLQLESEQLAESYRHEQQRNKHLQNEVHELLQKETALQDELQRLRLHLIGVEDRYTKEAITAQEHISFLKSKLTQVEERLHASSSAYTSASVRSNQQVESLENQVRTLTEKKDESKRQLVEVEKRVAQQAKDLMNLQTVLERFQQDKEREVLLVKERMLGEVLSWESKCSQLMEEIAGLKEQLKQAKEGLSAAARLSEQADKKSEIITSLKTEVKKLNASLISAEERLQDASLNVEGKVDRNLVKNLLIGYLSSPAQGSRRYEILRIVAMVLEFTEEERAKAELSDAGGKGWLRGLATGWSGHHSAREQDLAQPSLSEAFIRFLESESRPKTVPQLHIISESRAESTRSSTPATLGGGHSRTPSTSSTPPLLMSESLLPTLPTFSVASGSSGSCILKDVLKDS